VDLKRKEFEEMSVRFKQALLISLSALSVGAFAADMPKGVIAVVNGKTLNENILGVAVSDASSRGVSDSPALRSELLGDLIRSEILAQRAKQLGLANDPDTRARMAIAESNLLARELQRFWVAKNPPSDSDMKAEYERQVGELKKRGALSEFYLAHIVVSSEESALKIIDQLRNGGDFSKLAASQSLEPQTRTNGGEMGWVLPFNILPEIGNVVVNLDKGEVAQSAILTRVGWHVVKVNDKRPYKIPSYEASLNALRQAVMNAKWRAYMDGLIQAAKVER
jgi:peptidyl-prolyl cis-trans isomerase C